MAQGSVVTTVRTQTQGRREWEAGGGARVGVCRGSESTSDHSRQEAPEGDALGTNGSQSSMALPLEAHACSRSSTYLRGLLYDGFLFFNDFIYF